MATPCAQTTPSGETVASRGGSARGGNWLTRRINQSGSESGQALILTALAMTLVLLMSAVAIDMATWYQKHHQAQVAADAAALAAANCLANGKTTTSTGNNCTSPTDTTDAKSVANQIAATNLPTSTDQVQVDTISHTVTVTASATPQVDFAGLVSLHPTVSARSVASYSAPTAKYSVFVGNDTCATGTGLQIASGGGGNATVTGLYSDGVIDNQDNSNSAVWSGGISDGSTTGGYEAGATPMCGNGQGAMGSVANNNSWLTKNTTVVPGQETAYPEQYKPPVVVPGTTFTTDAQEPTNGSYTVTPGVCTFAATWFSTDGTGIHSLNWPGIYCVVDSSGNIATSYSGSCQWTPSTAPGADGTTGSIFVQSTLEGAFELVGPCVVGAANGTNDPGISSNIQAINDPSSPTGQDPIVYGTAQKTPVTAPCLVPSTTFVDPSQIAPNPPDNVYLYGNNLTLNGSIYAPCGTVEMNKNSAFNTFMEAANVTIDQNNFQSWAGTGPPSVPAQDSLTG
ncbi:MAG TPA: pilus assembly protein TadG-related protein [Solirubrobacteraceae bacterium]|nr:pilus assembly protein TadG-related protein [Solirubrobacteraceae bacterium]